ncbi:MAG TPA: sensor domain-containing diguanylate cyclase [Gaiellaceae bacterium]|nr:sensor domain-containing diguanylate cyclase [Gaiellaceae bacterium]
MNHALIATSAGLGALSILLFVLLATSGRRSRRRENAQVEQTVKTLETRMSELAGELAGAVERAEEETRRSRVLADLASSIDLDEVLSRTLDAAGALPGVDAAMVRLEADDAPPIVATLGLGEEEAERHAVSGPPDGTRVRSIEIGYRYPEGQGGALLRFGLAVPLADETGQGGHLTVFTRDAQHRFDNDDLTRLEELAQRAAPAIDNARRFREARRLADLDALTGLHNRRYFHETLARECARAHRYSRKLALLVFDLDDFKEVNDRIGHLAGDSALAEAAERLRTAMRTADVACRVGGDEFAVILPESGVTDGEQLFARIQQAISTEPIGQAGRMHLSAGVTELTPEDDSISLFERADNALYRAKEAGKGRAVSTADGRRTA